jgi:hypothetical protein
MEFLYYKTVSQNQLLSLVKFRSETTTVSIEKTLEFI